MQPSFMSNMILDEKQNGCDKSKMGSTRKFEQKRKAKMGKKKQIWSRPSVKYRSCDCSTLNHTCVATILVMICSFRITMLGI